MKKDKSKKNKDRYDKRFNVKPFLIAVIGLLVMGSAMPSLILGVGGIDVAGCSADPPGTCELNGVPIDPGFGRAIHDTVGLLGPLAYLAALIFGIIGGIKWVMSQATDDY